MKKRSQMVNKRACLQLCKQIEFQGVTYPSINNKIVGNLSTKLHFLSAAGKF